MLLQLSIIFILLPNLITSTSNVTRNLPSNFLLYNSKMELYGDTVPIKLNDMLYCSVNSISPVASSELRTQTGLPYQYILAPSEGCINFEVRTTNMLNISLNSDTIRNPPIYKIILGGWSNTKSAIYTDDDRAWTIVNTPGITSNNGYRGYWIEWNSNVIRVGVQGNPRNLMVLNDPNHLKINSIGFAGQGTGYWNIRKAESACLSQRSVYVKASCSL